jgi:signal transduction histidine kinase
MRPRFDPAQLSDAQWRRYGAWERGRGQEWRMPAGARLWIPVVLSLLVQVPAAIFVLTPWAARVMPAVVAEPWRAWVALALAVLGPLSLLLGRRFPGPVVAFVSAAAAADVLIGPPAGPPYVALAFAIIGAVVRGARLWAWISVGAAWVATLVIAAIVGIELKLGEVAFTTFGILLVMGIAEGLRSRREHMAEFRRAYAQRKVTEVQAERVRIARELHDVLAHSLSQINVQAGVGLHLMDAQPAKAAEALASIKETSKTALDEVRSVLGVLRSDDSDAPLVPEPGLDRVAGLVASVTSQGLDVSLTNTIDEAPKPVQLAIYRIAQESLTNVLRHSGATRASVDLGIEDGRYEITVSDNGSGFADDDEGRGILGMRERAELLGGTLATGRSPSGGAEIRVSIPVKETR